MHSGFMQMAKQCCSRICQLIQGVYARLVCSVCLNIEGSGQAEAWLSMLQGSVALCCTVTQTVPEGRWGAA